MAKSLPSRPHLEHLAKQAKQLLQGSRAGTAESLRLIGEHHPRFEDLTDAEVSSTSLRLADAQLVIARLYGFDSWTRLKQHVESITAEPEDAPVHEHVVGVEAFFQRFELPQRAISLVDWMRPQVEALFELHARRDPVVVMVSQLNHMPAERPSAEELFSSPLTLQDARQTIAGAYLFDTWQEVEAAGQREVQYHFEAAVDAVVEGSVHSLRELLGSHPDLVRQQSPYAHRATLLHYVAANGVEIRRQKSPRTAAQIARLLLEAGAEVDALCESYGGGSSQTTLCLCVSSYHPFASGVQGEIVEALLDHGAAVNGLDDDCTPLATALAFGYQSTAQVLARRGARVDNLVLAAGLGRLDLLDAMLDDRGELLSAQQYRDPFGEVVEDSRTLKDRAFFLACKQGLVEVARFLLARGADVDTAPNRRETALHWAAYEGHQEVVMLLVESGANTAIEDQQWKSTPLVWAAEGKHGQIVEYLKRYES